jgi:arylsulfatase A-like enzyme
MNPMHRPGTRVAWLLAAAVAVTVAAALAGGSFGCGRKQGPPNILLVVLDTVRGDAAGSARTDRDWEGLTPNLDRLAAAGTVFTNAWATAPWTAPSHASLFTGLLPSEHGCTWANTHLSEAHPTLAELMGQTGYATAAFFSNPWLADRTTGMLRGFAVRAETPIGGLNELTAPEGDQGGRQTLRSAAGWLGAQRDGRPFFAFVNFLEAHLPFNPPAEVRRRFLADLPPGAQVPIQVGHEYNAGLIPANKVDWRKVRRLYGGDVFTADWLLGDLIQSLKQQRLYDRTVIVVTSDHGENLGDHGLMDHQFSVHETLLRVPLVIRDPTGRLARGRRDDPVLLTDLFETLLDYGRVANPPQPAQSRSLLRPPGADELARPLIAEYTGPRGGLLGLMQKLNPAADVERLGRSFKTVRVGDLRLTVASDGSEELHDLAADPAQQVNIAAERPQAVEQLRGLLARHLASARGEAGSEAPLDSATIRQLESLGYIR